MDLTDEQLMAMAKSTAMVLQNSMAGVPEQVQIEAALLLVKAQFMAHVKPTHRISLFNATTNTIRKEIKADLEKSKGKKP